MPTAVEFRLEAVNSPDRSPTAANLHAAVTSSLALERHHDQEQPFAVWPVLSAEGGGLVLRVGWLPDDPPPSGLLSSAGWRFGPLHTRTRTVTQSRIPFAELVGATPGRRIRFDINSPMLFSRHGSTAHLPTTWLIWRSLLHRWNQHAPAGLALDGTAVEQAAQRAVVDRFALESRERLATATADGSGGWRERRIRGCVGWLEVALDSPADAELLTPLAGFAEVAGVGYMTTHGFGAVSVEVS
ncbi:MAG: CRISPR system precrRNA processing endoribonuclease RAMP protein Cas6 [Candidatus Nanopelagicales bacterium]